MGQQYQSGEFTRSRPKRPFDAKYGGSMLDNTRLEKGLGGCS